MHLNDSISVFYAFPHSSVSKNPSIFQFKSGKFRKSFKWIYLKIDIYGIKAFTFQRWRRWCKLNVFNWNIKQKKKSCRLSKDFFRVYLGVYRYINRASWILCIKCQRLNVMIIVFFLLFRTCATIFPHLLLHKSIRFHVVCLLKKVKRVTKSVSCDIKRFVRTWKSNV